MKKLRYAIQIIIIMILLLLFVLHSVIFFIPWELSTNTISIIIIVPHFVETGLTVAEILV